MTSRLVILLLVATLAMGAANAHERTAEQATGPLVHAGMREQGPRIPGIEAGRLAGLPMSDEQRSRVVEIQRDLQRAQLRLTGVLRELRWKQQDMLREPEIDAAAILGGHDQIDAVRRQYFAAALDARKRLEAVLTPEQRRALQAGKAGPARAP